MARPEITGRKTTTLRPLFDPPTNEDAEAEKQRAAAERARRAAERVRTHTGHAVKRQGFTIDEFCFAHGFTRAHLLQSESQTARAGRNARARQDHHH